MIRTTLALLAACALVVTAMPEASAQGDKIAQARSHYQQGDKLFAAGDYRGAITQFQSADRLAPSPLLHYNIGLCHERLGESAEALRRYRAYRVKVPNAANRAEVDGKIARLEAAMEAAAKPAPTPDPIAEPDPDPITGGEPSADPTPPPSAAGTSTGTVPTYAPTGDPALDRVASVNLGEVAARHPAVSAPAAPPAPVGAGTAGQPLNRSGAGNNTTATPPDDGGDKPKPLYKRWWFWVVVGVSAIILIDIATSGDDGNENFRGRTILDPSLNSPATAQSGGFALRF